MAPLPLTLWCLLLTNEKRRSGKPFHMEFDRDVNISELKKTVKETKSPRLNDVPFDELKLWKLSRDIHISTTDLALDNAIADLKFPNSRLGVEANVDVELELLDLGKELSDYWEKGPKPKHIHIIARAPRGIGLIPSISGDSNLAGSSQATQTNEETQASVDQFLKRYDKKLQEYLAGLPWAKHWKAPPSTNPKIASFINDLKIPDVLGQPMLLLHDIGNGIVDQDVLDKIFNGKSRFLVNTSGSGKTRLLLEGLSRLWGFYFTATRTPASNTLGSSDITNIIQRYIPKSKGFIQNPEILEGLHWDEAFQRNHDIAERQMSMAIMARVLIFERFLTIAQDTQPTRPIHEFQMHWLFLQLRSSDILQLDIFLELTRILRHATDEYLGIGNITLGAKIRSLQQNFGLGGQFVSVLDEGQVASDSLNNAFRSEGKMNKRPALRPIVHTWSTSTELPMIVSGTGLSMDFVNDVSGSGTVKDQGFTLVTDTGSFDDRERQHAYIARYVPDDLLQSDSGKELLERVWNWLHGRHRFTAAFLCQLLKSSFQSPQQILSTYIHKICGLRPSDIQLYSDEEKEKNFELRGGIMPFDFSKICDDPSLLVLFKKLLWHWLIYQRKPVLTGHELELVELGFAQFHRGQEDEAVVDEPLVLLAAARMLQNIPGCSFEDQIKNSLREPAGRGQNLEAFIGLYLASAFDGNQNLCDVFHFAHPIPELAKQTAETVFIVRDGGQTKAHHYHLRKGIDATVCIGCKCQNVKETTTWFENPSTLMCFPDNHMGSDIGLFVRLACGLILPVLVQCKWRSEPQMSATSQLEAQSTLDPSSFYGYPKLKDEKYGEARQRIQESFQSLKKSTHEINVDDRMFPLKVIVSFPAGVQDSLLGECVLLDMAPCLVAMDKNHLVQAVASSVMASSHPKRKTYDDIIDTPDKKRRKDESANSPPVRAV